MRTRTKEAVKVEAELTRDVLAEGLAIMAADVKSHKEKSHSAVKALQVKFKIKLFQKLGFFSNWLKSKYASDKDKVSNFFENFTACQQGNLVELDTYSTFRKHCASNWKKYTLRTWNSCRTLQEMDHFSVGI